jgi:hypothetical protein
MLPTYVFEAIWFLSWFFLCAIAATVFTRFVWSSLLLFVFNPDQVQIYLYGISILTTFYKFISDLNDPYARAKSTLVQNRWIMTTQAVQSFNKFILGMSKTQIFERKQTNEACDYLMIMKIKQFRELCSLVNIDYFMRQTLVRMFFTLFIIGMLFLGTTIFAGDGNPESLNNTMRILVSSLLPVIPNLIGAFAQAQQTADNTLFTYRFNKSLQLLESKYAPPNLPAGVYPKFVVLNTKPPKPLDPPPKPIDYATLKEL